MLWTFSEKCRWLFVTALLGSVLNTVFNTVTPQILRLTVDSVIGGAPFALPAALLAPVQALTAGKPIGTLLLYAAAAVALSAALSGCCFYVYRVCTIRCAETFTKNMRDRLFYHIQRLPLSWHSVNQTGDIVQRCTSDVEVVRSFIAGQLTEVFRIVFLIAFALSVMFSMNVTLSLIALAFIPIVVTYSFIFFRKIGSRFRDADEAEGDLTAACPAATNEAALEVRMAHWTPCASSGPLAGSGSRLRSSTKRTTILPTSGCAWAAC